MRGKGWQQFQDKSVCGVIFLILAHVLINYIWLRKDTFPLWFDYGCYFKRSIEIYYSLQTGFVNFFKAVLGTGRYSYSYNPHRFILPLFAVPWYFIMGLNPDTAVMSCTVFLAIALFSTYAIASRIFDRTTGFLAAFILSVSPGFFTAYRRFSPEFAVTAMIALTAYLLLRSKNFQNRFYSIFFGISFALCMFTKEIACAFIFPMLAHALYSAGIIPFSNKHQHRVEKKIIGNLTLSLLVPGIMAFLIYWLHRKTIFNLLFLTAYSSEMRQLYGMPFAYNMRGLMFFGRTLFTSGILPFYCVCFFVGVLFCLLKRNSNRGFLFSWLIGSYIILCSTQTRAFEYAIPLIIPIAILASYGLNMVGRYGIKRIMLIVFALVWGAVQLYLGTFAAPMVPDWIYYRNMIVPPGFKSYYPVREDWKLKEAIRYILNNKSKRDGAALVHVGANLYAFSSVTLSYVAVQKNAKLNFCGYNASLGDTLSCNFVIIKSGENQGIFYSYKQMLELRNALHASGNFIKLPETFLLPDKSIVEIYKKYI